MKRYGHTFLTCTRASTRDADRADQSRFIWRLGRDDFTTSELSLLGIVNGLPVFSWWWQLCIEINLETRVVGRAKVVRRDSREAFRARMVGRFVHYLSEGL